MEFNYIIKNYNHVPHLINPTRENRKYCHSLLVFDPYGGCSHNCLFCYSNMGLALIHNQQRASEIHIRINTIKLIKNFLGKYHKLKYPIRISSTNDPLQPCERKFNLTFKTLKLFNKYNYPLILCTKGEISEKILNVLEELAKKHLVSVQISLPFTNSKISKFLEPATSIHLRLQNIKLCVDKEIPITIRYQPIFPYFKNMNKMIEDDMLLFKKMGVNHIIGAFLKLPYGRFNKYMQLFNELQNIEDFNFKDFANLESWEKDGFYVKPKHSIRKEIIEFIAKTCQDNKMDYTSCKEGFWNYNSIKDCCGGLYETYSKNWFIDDRFSKKLLNLFYNYPQVHKFFRPKRLLRSPNLLNWLKL